MGKASRDKGARGERLAVKFLESLGFKAQRMAQRNGKNNSGDVILLDYPEVLVEVKYGMDHVHDGSKQWWKWVEQAEADHSSEDGWVLFRKRTRGPWSMVCRHAGFIVVLHSEGDMLSMLHQICLDEIDRRHRQRQPARRG